MTRSHVVFCCLVAVVVILVAVKVVPYVLADRETRRSMWQARVIRWRWARLSRMLGLVVTDPTPTLLSALMGERARGPRRPASSCRASACAPTSTA